MPDFIAQIPDRYIYYVARRRGSSFFFFFLSGVAMMAMVMVRQTSIPNVDGTSGFLSALALRHPHHIMGAYA
eukprot:scaffold3652_cov83-Skeletonema_dohrnii-CCMP3373.AAC.2